METKSFTTVSSFGTAIPRAGCAGAAKAAAQLLLTGEPVEEVRIMTPRGVPLTLEVLDPVLGAGTASCAIRKDGAMTRTPPAVC